MAGTKTIDELINQFQEPIDTGKSIDDIMQQSNLIEAIASAVSTRAQPSDKSISDISIPTSEKYGAPADIRIDGTVSKGIPMNMLKIRDALNEALTSPEHSVLWDDERTIPQNERAEQSLGELLGMTAGFNKTREGKRLIQDILDKSSKMNTPGGLVAYRTEEGFPSYFTKTGVGKRISGIFQESGLSGSPDTIAIFGDKSSWSQKPLKDDTVEQSRAQPSRTLLHEVIHSAAKEGTPLKEMAQLSSHQKRFAKTEKDIIDTFKKSPTKYGGEAYDPWLLNLLHGAIMDEESEGTKFLKDFIK